MKRSHINDVLERSEAFLAAHRFALPPFAYWAPERWREPEAAPLRAAGLGWDVTDYGAGRFDTYGLTLFTIRNGRLADLAAGRGRLYAEKILIAGDGQLAPMHRHDLKVEDIINRGGGTLVLELYGAAEDGALDKHRALALAMRHEGLHVATRHKADGHDVDRDGLVRQEVKHLEVEPTADALNDSAFAGCLDAVDDVRVGFPHDVVKGAQ
jgi:D-lyxose ketol-isomerase